jgi:hypothetical protein
MDVDEEYKVSQTKLKIVWENGFEQIVEVTKINTRQEAIKLCEKTTKECLLKPDAYIKLNSFRNEFSRHRNYELEVYLDSHSSELKRHKIVEICPFDGFSWFGFKF